MTMPDNDDMDLLLAVAALVVIILAAGALGAWVAWGMP